MENMEGRLRNTKDSVKKFNTFNWTLKKRGEKKMKQIQRLKRVQVRAFDESPVNLKNK